MRALLADLRDRADYLRPFELLARILVRHDGRRQLVARLGAEAEDGIDALIDQALAYESVEAPSVTGFLDWFDRDEVKVKRRTDEGADQVRVMTVHGAKGLEAPIVILPDTASPPGRRATRRRSCGSPTASRSGRSAPSSRRRPSSEAEDARRELVRAESRRLLYVGAHPRQVLAHRLRRRHPRAGAARAGTTLVAEAMTGLGALREPGPRRRHPRALPPLDRRARGRGRRAAAGRRAARLDPPPGAPCRRPGRAPLSPSGLGGAHVLAGRRRPALSTRPRPRRAAPRSTACSSTSTAARRPTAAASPPGCCRPADLPALLAEASALLDAPELAYVFGPDSLAEVALTAPLAALGGARLLGRLDRLVVGPDRILAVDFKSHAAVPAGAGGRPRRHPPPDGRLPRGARRDLARTAASWCRSSGATAG